MVEFDYCDRCGDHVRAYTYFETARGGTLTYCGSHGTAYEGAIQAQGGRLTHDFRYMRGD